MLRRNCVLFTVALLFCLSAKAQDSAMIEIPDKYLKDVDKKINDISEQLTKQSNKYLENLSSQEEKIKNELAKLDSSRLIILMGNSKKAYEKLSQKLSSVDNKAKAVFSGQYLPYIDSLQGSLKFLKDAKNILSKSKDLQGRLSTSLSNLNALQHKLNEAENMKQFIQQRQEQLKNLFADYTNLPQSIGKYLGKYQKQVYYYGQQVKDYKEALNNPDKMLKKVLSVLNHVPSFQKFMQKYSMLSGIFASADDPSAIDPSLPTRSQVNQLVQQRIANGGQNAQEAFSQQLQQAKGELSKLKDKFSEMGVSPNGDMNMPDFKPNNLKTKSFLKRLELGSNMQSQRANNYYPVTTDFAFTLGYKLSEKSVVGVGLSGKAGWGRDWKHIKITGEGVGMRFFVDWKAKGHFWLTGGAEMNYLRPVSNLEQFKNYSNWNRSALIGISRKYKVGKKINGNMQILYDFLYKKHVPPTDPIMFRLGYNF